MYAGFAETPPTREELGAAIATGGLAGSCWDLPDPDDPDDPDREEAEAALARARAAAARYAAHYGLDTPETVDDLVTLLVAAGVLLETPGPAGTVLSPVRPVPRPGDVFPLDDTERQALADLERRHTHGRGTAAVIGLFTPRGVRLTEITTSQGRLARAIGQDTEHARQCVLQLIEDGDLTATADVTTLAGHNVFRLHRDQQDPDPYPAAIRHRTEAGPTRTGLPESP